MVSARRRHFQRGNRDRSRHFRPDHSYFGFKMAEVTCPMLYFDAPSSIDFRRSVKYGVGWGSLADRGPTGGEVTGSAGAQALIVMSRCFSEWDGQALRTMEPLRKSLLHRASGS
jgi:hypothetical protein